MVKPASSAVLGVRVHGLKTLILPSWHVWVTHSILNHGMRAVPAEPLLLVGGRAAATIAA